jgi:hypothetical protein
MEYRRELRFLKIIAIGKHMLEIKCSISYRSMGKLKDRKFIDRLEGKRLLLWKI